MDNRERLLLTALELFNEHGTAQVSINQILKATGISAGNLYYHFKNKDDIILSIQMMIRQEYDNLLSDSTDQQVPYATLQELFTASFHITWKYRFFYREFPILFLANNELRNRFLSIKDSRTEQIRQLMARGVSRGFFKESIIPDVPNIIDAIWMIHSFWIPHVEMRDGALTPQGMQDGMRLVLRLLHPHLTEKPEITFPELYEDTSHA